MSWSIEVYCYDRAGGNSGLGRYTWQKVRSTYGAPYEYATKREAADMAAMCYGGMIDKDVRIVENKK